MRAQKKSKMTKEKASRKVIKKALSKATKKKLPKEDPASTTKPTRKVTKAQLKATIEALKKEPDPLLARKVLKYIPCYLKSQGLTKKILKEIVRLWADGTEKVRVVCLLCLIRIYTKLHDKERKQLLIKQLYTTFLDKCRVAKLETMAMIGFMRYSLIELYKVDPQISFKQAQASCQQLAITLKNALTHKNEESYKSVLNWQFANCLILLSQLITSHDDESPIKTLTHQVIQMNLAAISLLSSPRYYPFYCHLIENLIHLGNSANVFIPILPIIISIVKRIQVGSKLNADNKKVDKEEVNTKEYSIDLLNHVSLEEAHSDGYIIAVLDKIYDLLTLYMASQCHKIAFPELVFIPCVQLKKWIKKNPNCNSVQKFKSLLEKIRSDCHTIEESRKSIEFGFTDLAAVDAWEKKTRDSKCLILSKLTNKL